MCGCEKTAKMAKRRKRIGKTKALSLNAAQPLLVGAAGALASRAVSKYILPILPFGQGIFGTVLKFVASLFIGSMGGSAVPFAVGMAADTVATPVGSTLGISRRRRIRGNRGRAKGVGTAAVHGTTATTATAQPTVAYRAI